MIAKIFKIVKYISEKILMTPKNGQGKIKKNLRRMNFCLLVSPPKADLGWEAFPKEICEANLSKPAKVESFLIENFLSPVFLKIKIFAGFGDWHQPSFRKRWAGLPRWTSGQSEVGIRILFKIGSIFVQKIPL